MKRILAISLLVMGCLLAGAMTPGARKSLEELKSHAEAGDAGAMYRYSALLERGYDTIPADSAESLRWLSLSARAGNAAAMNYLGFLYGKGYVAGGDTLLNARRDSAYYWIRKASDAGNALASYNLSYMMSENNADIDSVIKYLKRGASGGIPAAMTMLAGRYADGKGVEKDTLKAVELYEKAIAKGWNDAELRLLNMMGRKWVELSDSASFELALKYMKLNAPVISAELLKQIGPDSEQTDAAYALLGEAYSLGRGVPYDHDKSIEYFYESAKRGNPGAKFILAETLDIFPDALNDIVITGERPAASILREEAQQAGIDNEIKALQYIRDGILKYR
ncbi:MAG: sel1 repeat family protein [Candidatus Amulumruptor caecigallinarius]|nr:sel1 repeat family protein [Candidatus Amulumruptor caecigallinarius]